jgi:signal transduction histidine kinase
MLKRFPFFTSLRWKIVLLAALPVFVTLSFLSYSHYNRERQTLIDVLDATAVHLGEVMRGSLRHAMLSRNMDQMQMMLDDIGGQQSVLRVAIFNANVQLALTNKPEDFIPSPSQTSPGCVECHRPEGILDQHSVVIDLPDQGRFLRSSTIIPNDPACYACHDPSQKMLGVLIADFSLIDLESHILSDLQINLALSLLVTTLISIAIYYWINVFIIRRVEQFAGPLKRFGEGDFSARVPVDYAGQDELSRLQIAFNGMAAELERHVKMEQQARDARYQAVMDERQRLARELHDSTAQVLGYVGTKATAVRLFIEQGELTQASAELRQLDEAARSVFADMRQAILDLKTNVSEDRDFASSLAEYIVNFERYSDIPTGLIVKNIDELQLPPGDDLQILRIVQEALANVRKHAGASRAVVTLERDSEKNLIVTVTDDGAGFDPSADPAEGKPHFGLATMQERAHSIGASFHVESQPGLGTSVRVILPLEGEVRL